MRASHPLRWVTPQRLVAGVQPARGRFILRTTSFARHPVITVHQGDELIHRQRINHAVGPNRSFTIDAAWTTRVVDHATALTLRLE